MRWIAREHQFNFPRPTIVMGIVNTTPDSFTDGGRFLDADAAGAHALRLASAGAGGLAAALRRCPNRRNSTASSQ